MVTVRTVSVICIIVNALLTAAKLFWGIRYGSMALVSDGFDSMADVLSAVITLIAVRLASEKEDSEHPYGHERFENVAALLLADIMTVTAAVTAKDTLGSFKNGGISESIGTPALAVSAVSILSKLMLSVLAVREGRRNGSIALVSQGDNYRSDAVTSCISLAGVGGAVLGLRKADLIAGLVICIIILKAAFGIFRDAVSGLVDSSAPEEISERFKEIALGVEGVKNVDSMMTRRFGEKIYVETEIAVDGDIPLKEAHDIAQSVHDLIEADNADVKHCTVHVNPYQQ